VLRHVEGSRQVLAESEIEFQLRDPPLRDRQERVPVTLGGCQVARGPAWDERLRAPAPGGLPQVAVDELRPDEDLLPGRREGIGKRPYG
jgi:hypothetical protein